METVADFLRYFEFNDVYPDEHDICEAIQNLAHTVAFSIPVDIRPESGRLNQVVQCLQKLLEARDCAIRGMRYGNES